VAPVAQGAQVPLTPWCLVAAEGTVVTGTLLDYDFFDFPETVGKFIPSQLTLTPSFFRGVGIPPTSYIIIYNHYKWKFMTINE
jgi:hypothetical protein